MRKLLLAAAFLTISTAAQAVFIDGTITLRPLATIDGTGNTQTVTFTPPPGSQIYPPAFQSGNFLTFGADSTFAMNPTGPAVPWQSFLGDVASGLSADALASWSYTALVQTSNVHTADEFSITGYGTLLMTGFQPTLANFWLSWQRPFTDTNFPPPPPSIEFSLNAYGQAAVPGPIVGAGLPGLLLALGGLIALARRRAKNVSA
jgi:hypothetical protein